MKEPVVLHLIQGLALTGGTPAKLFTLIQYSKYKHIVFCCNNERNGLYLSQWEKHCDVVFGMKVNHIYHNIIMIRRIIKEHQVNVIHVYFPPETFLCGFLKILFPRIKFVRSFEGNMKQGLIKKLFTNWGLAKFDKAIYISKYIRQCFECRIPKRLVNKGVIIYNSASREPQTKSEIHHNVKIGKLLYVAGLNYHKNLFVLVDVVKILKDMGVIVHLDYVGDGVLKSSLQKKIDEYDLNNEITLQGFRDNVIEYLDKCSIYLHPADDEGFGIAVVEAMQQSCPIVVSNKGGVTEIIDDGIDGLIADAYDAKDWAKKIESILKNQQLADQLGHNAYETAYSKFSIANYVNKHDEMYKILLHNSK